MSDSIMIRPELKLSSIEAMKEYWTVFSRMDKLSLCKLFSVLKEIEGYGINGFTRRVIDKRGYSATLSTSKLWKEVEFEPGCQEEASKHFSTEVPKAKIKKLQILTRSSDKTDTDFLRRMDWKRINNSVIILDFKDDNIKMNYFICDQKKPMMRDKIISDLCYFAALLDNIGQELDFLTSSVEFNAKKTPTLSLEALNKVGSQLNSFSSRQKKQVWINGTIVELSLRELEVLSNLKYGLSNEIISQRCTIGVSRIKKIVEELKYKLCVMRRQDLKTLAYKIIVKEKAG